MDSAPLPPLPSFTSDKARALAGLTPEERQELLAAAGALGISHDHDPFWITQALYDQLKTLLHAARADMAETREIATDAMGEARAVAKQLRPSADLAAQHIKSTVETVQANLTDKAAASIAKAIAVEVRRQLQDREAGEVISSQDRRRCGRVDRPDTGVCLWRDLRPQRLGGWRSALLYQLGWRRPPADRPGGHYRGRWMVVLKRSAVSLITAILGVAACHQPRLPQKDQFRC